MKLSKQALMNALILATEKTASLVFAGAQNALQEDALEIEGYERADHFADDSKMGWTKFDPNDSKTFPKKKDGRVFLVHFIYNHEQIVEYASFNFSSWTGAEVTHWRPLPKPPAETEVGE